jgi:uncharacterized protein (TIGR03083 family)
MPDRDAADAVDRAHRMIGALRGAQDRLAALVASLEPADLARPSYDDDWTIAQVLSHMGSQAEIFGQFLDAGLAGRDAPGPEIFAPVWEAWNAKPPAQQAADDVLATFDITLFGMEADAATLARMRLSEIAVHTWDVAVALDPRARLDAEVVVLLFDSLFQLAQYVGKADAWPGPHPFRVDLHVTDEHGTTSAVYALTIDDAVRLAWQAGPDANADPDADANVTLPAEALLRLIYGRLDPDHTPAGAIERDDDVDLDALRAVFPGF